MIILGIDPGLAILGYGVIEYIPSGTYKALDYGCITTPADMPMPQRLIRIYEGVSLLIDNSRADAVAMEELFFNKNVKTALTVGHARGAALVAAAQKTQELYEYTPLQVKQAVTGYGRADKQQVQIMIAAILNMNHIPKPDDAADALAVAVCHANSCGMPQSFRI